MSVGTEQVRVVLADDDPLDHFGTRADKAIILDDGRAGL